MAKSYYRYRTTGNSFSKHLPESDAISSLLTVALALCETTLVLLVTLHIPTRQTPVLARLHNSRSCSLSPSANLASSQKRPSLLSGGVSAMRLYLASSLSRNAPPSVISKPLRGSVKNRLGLFM